MGLVRKIILNDREILEVDYSNSKEAEMIELITHAAGMVQAENKVVSVLSCFSKNYITPTFMRTAEKEVGPLKHLIEKQAIVGLTPTQEFILQGFNFFLKRNFKSFKTREEAIRYLLEFSMEDDLPEYFK